MFNTKSPNCPNSLHILITYQNKQLKTVKQLICSLSIISCLIIKRLGKRTACKERIANG